MKISIRRTALLKPARQGGYGGIGFWSRIAGTIFKIWERQFDTADVA